MALIIGEDELANQQVTVKYLREDIQQQCIAQSELVALLNTVLV
ncbi:histidyl-tRNA synthetase [Agarivorans albus MKT 106]|uniref:Histidyl-tRNA synthetase n=1 Tax=Agarivorans albus MKT 106 TaxID=1331007 RepID=R9PJD2_AGAAL|nr:histidyl-tRNA synthetase [Agarivorans albus MKT 106]